MNRTLLATVVVGISGSALVAPPALAQNALGSGNALDANLQVGNRRNAAGRDIKKELAFRNAIVTGNAGAGLSFRGDIGYRAADDFRSTTGTDQFFNFRRDSDYSGLATLNIRGISSVQDQFNFATGGQTRSLGSNDLIVQRSSAGITANQLSTDQLANRNRIDPMTRLGSGSLRSTSNGLLRDSGRPTVLAYESRPESASENDQKFLIASPLQGVRSIPQRNAVFGFTPRPVTGFQTPDQIAAAESKALTEAAGEKTGASLPEFVSPFDSFRKQLETRVNGQVNANPLDTSVNTLGTPTELTAEQREKAGLPGIEVPKALDGAEASAEKKDPDSFDARLDRLREVLSGSDLEGDRVTDNRDRLTKEPAQLIPGIDEKPTETTRKAVDPEEMVAGSKAQRDARIRQAIDDAKRLVGTPETIASLKPKMSTDEFFAAHMTKGEQHLADGRWFDAEERFALALSLHEGDPMAAAGRVHAQIAAGMYISAALNLRNLFRAYPELIAAKYDQKLLPRGARLETVRAQLRARSTRDTLLARDAGLLLTYLGWQTGSEQDVRDGMAIVDRVNEKMGIEADPLDAALRAIWVK
ncbi:MAG: hypothetical protein ACKVZJ_11410 [Phycisphaerales bacterium]